MAITLNGLVLDGLLTSVREQHQEVGGRDARMVEFAGLLHRETSVAALEARLDAVLHAASAVDYSAALSIRPGRRLMVRRAAFRREIQRDSLAGAFTLKLEARDPFEEAEALTEAEWPIAASPAVLAVASGGTAFALPDPPDRRRDPDPARRQRRRTLSRVRRHRARRLRAGSGRGPGASHARRRGCHPLHAGRVSPHPARRNHPDVHRRARERAPGPCHGRVP